MRKHNHQWSIGSRGSKSRTKPTAWSWLALGALLLFHLARKANTSQDLVSESIESKLAQQVAEFDNNDAPLIPTLLRVAAEYHLPMGIERLTSEGLGRPVRVRLKKGTLADLLDMCARQLPGYVWAVSEGAIDFFSKNERRQSSNLFNLVIPSFSLSNETLDEASDKLRTTVIMKREKLGGVIGSYLGSPALEDKRLSVQLRDRTVRDILNRMVALHGEAAWIARVPEGQLSHMPKAGLWQILPRSVRDPRGLIEPLPEKAPGPK